MKHTCLLLLLLIGYGAARAQQAATQQLHFNFLGVREGLPEGSVNCMLQDKYGYLWIGTQNGLVRFDGYQTKNYALDSTSGIITDIQDIYEDSKGRLWVGTYPKGFYCLDRLSDKFTIYELNPPGEQSKENYVVLRTTEDNDDNLWMRVWNYRKGLQCILRFDTKTKQAKRYSRIDKGAHFIDADNFYDVFKDARGTIWIGTDNGFYHYDAKKDGFTGHYNTTDSLQQKGVWQFAQDSTNADVLWATGWNMKDSKNEGLWCYDIKQQSLQKFIHNPKDTSSIANDEILALKNFKKGYLWMGTDTGISLFNTATEHFENYSPADSRKKSYDNYVKAIAKDADGNLWCRSAHGLLFFNTSTRTFTRYTADNKNAVGMQSSSIRSMLLTRDGMLWFGADQAGLQWINTGRSKFTLYTNSPGKPHHFTGGAVNSFAQTGDGTIWVTAAKGLFHWFPATDSFIQITPVEHPAADLYANSAAIDKDGAVWCRMYGNAGTVAGIYRYEPATKKWTNYRHHDKDTGSLPDDNVRALQFDRDGILWIGTYGKGISSFDTRTAKFTSYPYIKNTGYQDTASHRGGVLDDDEVQTIFIDLQNTVWAGTNNGNLNKFDRNSRTFTANGNNIPGFSTIISVYSDNRQQLWAGTYMSGLFRFDAAHPGAYKKYTQSDGLLYNGCWGINEDQDGNTWIVTVRGLSVINSRTGAIRNVSDANGLPEEPGSSGLFKTGNGLFLTGSKNGFFSWHPAEFSAGSSPAPRMHIESVSFFVSRKAGDSTITSFGKNELQLRYDENRITFYYVGLEYQSAGLVQYRYQLEGYDNEWRNGGTQRQVTYTNLSPGTYHFHVKAMNSEGRWSVQEDAITIIISPPWWKTWWAWCLYVLLAAAALWWYIRYRSRALRRENILLEEKIAHRTSQLEQSLANLQSTQAQLIQSEKMASLGELTAGIAHEIQNPLNFVNNFAEVSSELVDEMNQELDKGDTTEARAIAGDIQQNLQKINLHGKRADAIVKGMLQHSRTSTGDKGAVNINALTDEYLRLAYHGQRAKDKSFNATLQTDFDDAAGSINAIPQDIGRVLLNIITNALYAVGEKKKTAPASYEPRVSVHTKKINQHVAIKVADNGDGIPAKIVDKIFQPFFTTKPTGQGTGLGLSLAWDIVKAHGGQLKVETTAGEGSVFIIELPA